MAELRFWRYNQPVLILSCPTSAKNVYTDSSFAIFDKVNNNRRSAITYKLLTGGLNNPLTSGNIPLKSMKTGEIVFGVMDSSNSYKLYISNSTGTVLDSIDNIDVT